MYSTKSDSRVVSFETVVKLKNESNKVKITTAKLAMEDNYLANNASAAEDAQPH